MNIDPQLLTAMITTGAAIGGSATAGKLVEKLFGPTAEYWGTGLRNWNETAYNNTAKVLWIAARKLKGKIEEPGIIPPKVIKGILEEAPFCNDIVSADYLGGVLASSRTNEGRDDRGAALVATIGRLSSYHLRAHYVFYHIVSRLNRDEQLWRGFDNGKNPASPYKEYRTYISSKEFVRAVDLKAENPELIIPQVLFGLTRELLISDGDYSSNWSSRRSRAASATERVPVSRSSLPPGLLFSPTYSGVELFLWAHGQADSPPEEFFRKDSEFELLPDVSIKGSYSFADISITVADATELAAKLQQ